MLEGLEQNGIWLTQPGPLHLCLGESSRESMKRMTAQDQRYLPTILRLIKCNKVPMLRGQQKGWTGPGMKSEGRCKKCTGQCTSFLGRPVHPNGHLTNACSPTPEGITSQGSLPFLPRPLLKCTHLKGLWMAWAAPEGTIPEESRIWGGT